VWGIERNLGLISAVAQFTWQNGGKPFSDDRKAFLLHEPPALEAIQFLVDLVLRHQVAPTPEEQQAAGADLWLSGRQAMILGGRFSVPALLTVPWPPGMALATSGPRRNATRGDDLGSSIPKGARQPDAAWEYAKLWSSPIGQATVMKSGRSYTARRSYARGDEIKQFLRSWEDQETYFRGLEWTEVFPIMPRYPEVLKLFDQHMTAIVSRQEGVRDGMLAARSDIDPLLQEGWG
jgi:multiple sugar transport system substrate-binding protein